jgi:tetratricopeptide (TPR) repeat protein
MKSLMIGILLSFSMSCLFGFQPDSLVRKGNDLYAKGQYYDAIDVYEQVVDSGYMSAELYFNLGNSYYKINNIPLAILNYERAKKINPWDKDIRHNLAVANARIVDKIDVIPEFFLKNWINNIVNITSSNNWAVISISSFVLFLVLFLFYLFSSGIILKKFSFWFGILVFILSVTSFYSSLKRKQFLASRDSGIIISPTVTAKSSPDEWGVDLFVIHEGTRVVITESIGMWNEIRISDGKRGWITKSDLARI